jgi:hypothetical protein
MPERDRRRSPRHAATGVTARLRSHQALRLLDLGPDGARLESTEWLAPGRRYEMRLPGLDLGLAAFVTRCRVVRVEDDEVGGRAVFEAGVRFESPAESDRARLTSLLTDLAGSATRGAGSPLRLASGF